MKIISRFWKVPAWGMTLWGAFIVTMMAMNFAVGNVEEGEEYNMFIATLIFGLLPLIIGLLILQKLKRDYKLLDKQRTLTNLLILAKQNSGNLTLSEVMIKLNLSHEKARELLDQQVYKGIATLEMTEEGNTYYDFKDY